MQSLLHSHFFELYIFDRSYDRTTQHFYKLPYIFNIYTRWFIDYQLGPVGVYELYPFDIPL